MQSNIEDISFHIKNAYTYGRIMASILTVIVHAHVTREGFAQKNRSNIKLFEIIWQVCYFKLYAK